MYILGIDFGSRYLKCALCVQNMETAEITVLKLFKTKHRASKKGSISDLVKAKEAFAEITEKIGNEFTEEIDRYVISISGENVGSYTGTSTIPLWKQENEERRMKINKAHVNEVLKAAKMTAYNKDDKTEIHSIPQEFQIDDQPPTQNPVDMSGIKLKGTVYVIQTDKGHKENLSAIMEDAGIENYRIVFSPLATAEAVTDEEDKESGVIVVSVNDQTTELAIYLNGIVRMAKVIPYGSNNITKDLKIVLKTDYKTANDIKKNDVNAFSQDTDAEKMISISKNSSSETTDYSERYVSKVAEARLKEIYEFVTKEIYKGAYQRMIHSPVIITGPGSRIQGAEKLFGHMNNSKTVTGTMEGIRTKDQNVTDEYFTSVGLVKYAVNNDIFSEDGDDSRQKGIIERIKEFLRDLL
ncbi:MAG: cell division protein FtsA [Candidatus Delongbacteria bacterium]